AASAVADQVGGDAIEVIAPVGLVVEGRPALEQPVVALLEQIVGDLAVAADPRKIAPQRARGALVEGAERLFVHGQGYVRGIAIERIAVELADIETGHVSHGTPATLRR